MYLLQTSTNATGTWYKVEESGDFILSLRSDDDLGGGTLYIDVADFAQNTLPGETDRGITTIGAPIIVHLKKGMHIRGRLSGATGPDVNLFLGVP